MNIKRPPLLPSGQDVFQPMREFFKLSSAGGILLVIAAVLALVVANTELYALYDYVLHTISFRIGFDSVGRGGFDFEVKKSLLHWVNDGFMAVFFFLVGLEIKRELMTGELSTRSRAILPFLAAIGGMAAPALVYYFINSGTPENLAGWAIPSATDIAFALGVLALLGTRAPMRLKILLMAIAVIDDLGAILIIAVFYSHDLEPVPFLFAAAALAGLAGLNLRKVSSTAPYIILGIILWVAVLKSGVHATLAGVATALFIPMSCPKREGFSPAKHLEHALHPWVAFGILPIFAFANAGVPFTGMGLHSLGEPVTLGITLGLVLGKQVGIFLTLWLAIKLGLSPMPKGVRWVHLYGVSILCGIGFTMSLFIGGLAFADLHHQASIRLGVLVGSIFSACLGYAVLYLAPQAEDPTPTPKDQWK
ncbi:MAG: Na+/H+ antiporter NhaA [Alphaproteobacteria bacterium]|nr:Na+/H+ antiporter NhaA [Alphaproteobacteria bacterium]